MNLDEDTADAGLTALLEQLRQRGLASAPQLQAALGISQPTLWRRLAHLQTVIQTGTQGLTQTATQVVSQSGRQAVRSLGAGRSTRYAWPQPIVGRGGEQPLWAVDEAGQAHRCATLLYLGPPQAGAGQGRLAVQWEAVPGGGEPGSAGSVGSTHTAGASTTAELFERWPWYLATLRAEGWLGRCLARRLAPFGLDANPERWPFEHQIFAALHTPDAPGALLLGEPEGSALPGAPATALPTLHREADYDQLAAEEGTGQRAGSSAGGEQSKFLARNAQGHPVLVKFSPPRGTPFGERWHDLLHAEALALQVLSSHGVPVAATECVQTAQRSYLVSSRFDRLTSEPSLPSQKKGAATGRRHALPLHAVHASFVGGPQQHWAATCEALERQGQLPAGSGYQVRALMHFGRLIGNSDMHFGNLSLLTDAMALWHHPALRLKPRFSLAPVYDMLPMHWRPDPATGELYWTPLALDDIDLRGPAREVAQEFWERATELKATSRGFRGLAGEMARRVRDR